MDNVPDRLRKNDKMWQPLESLYIQQFRGLGDAGLDNLGIFNLILGGNNSGKTSVLEAMALSCRASDALEWQKVLNRREIGINFTDMAALSWIFPRRTESGLLSPGMIKCELSGRFPIRSVTHSYDEFQTLIDLEATQFSLDLEHETRVAQNLDKVARIHTKVEYVTPQGLTSRESGFEIQPKLLKYLNLRPQSIPELPVYTVSPHQHKIRHNQTQDLSDVLLDQGQTENLNRILNAFDNNITRIGIIAQESTNPKIFLDHSEQGSMPLHCFGDGLRRVVALAIGLSKSQNGLLLIDELEVSFHAGILPKVIDWLVESANLYHVQVCASSHSIETIDALLAVTESRPDSESITAYRLGRHNEVKRFGAASLRRLRNDLGVDPR